MIVDWPSIIVLLACVFLGLLNFFVDAICTVVAQSLAEKEARAMAEGVGK